MRKLWALGLGLTLFACGSSTEGTVEDLGGEGVEGEGNPALGGTGGTSVEPGEGGSVGHTRGGSPDAFGVGEPPGAGGSSPTIDGGGHTTFDAGIMPEPNEPEDTATQPRLDAAELPKQDAPAEPAPKQDAAAELPKEDAAAEPPPKQDAAAEPPKQDAANPPKLDAGTPTGTCNARMQSHPSEGTIHLTLCSNITYKTNPPNSGNHYPAWAAYRTYSRPIPWGFLVHSLEHGAMVITYNCPEGCAAEVAQAQAFIDALPVTCGGGVKRKVILMPDPKLDVRFAASAWLYTLKADCFDAQAFQNFYNLRYNKGREDSCNQGTDPTGESTGRAPLCGL